MTVTKKTEDNIEERLVSLTRDLILIPSTPQRPEDRQRCYEFIRNHLEAFEHIEVREFVHNDIPSLVAAPRGMRRPEILMCGHLDVIAHPDPSVYHSRIKDGRIYGPGAGDMKGALAVLMEIFRHMHAQYDNISLGVAITADEELGGEAGVGYLFNHAGISCSQGMIPDGGSLNEITIEEKGILHLKVSCKGQSAHAARPWLGDNAIEKLMMYLNRLKKYFTDLKHGDNHWHPTCTITMIGTKNETFNRVPATASAVLDVRFPFPLTVNAMMGKIREHLTDEVNIEVVISAEPTNLSPDPLYQKVTEEVTQSKATLVRDDGGSDARFLSALGIPVMISRPLVGNLHAQDEWIDIKSMVKFFKIYEKYLQRKLVSL